jgi:hypothetical protein
MVRRAPFALRFGREWAENKKATLADGSISKTQFQRWIFRAGFQNIDLKDTLWTAAKTHRLIANG